MEHSKRNNPIIAKAPTVSGARSHRTDLQVRLYSSHPFPFHHSWSEFIPPPPPPNPKPPSLLNHDSHKRQPQRPQEHLISSQTTIKQRDHQSFQINQSANGWTQQQGSLLISSCNNFLLVNLGSKTVLTNKLNLTY